MDTKWTPRRDEDARFSCHWGVKVTNSAWLGLGFCGLESRRVVPEAGSLHGTPVVCRVATFSWQDKRITWWVMSNLTKPFVAARNKWIVPKERRIERIPSGYSVREFHDDSRGRYWYVVAALEVTESDTHSPKSRVIIARFS